MSHVSLSSLTSFQKHTHQGLKEDLRFSSQEPSPKWARWTFLPDTRFSKVKQYTTQKHTMVKTGCHASSCFPFLPGPRVMLRSHPSLQGAQSCHCILDNVMWARANKGQACHQTFWNLPHSLSLPCHLPAGCKAPTRPSTALHGPTG